jgi:hypothetical protein
VGSVNKPNNNHEVDTREEAAASEVETEAVAVGTGEETTMVMGSTSHSRLYPWAKEATKTNKPTVGKGNKQCAETSVQPKDAHMELSAGSSTLMARTNKILSKNRPNNILLTRIIFAISLMEQTRSKPRVNKTSQPKDSNRTLEKAAKGHASSDPHASSSCKENVALVTTATSLLPNPSSPKTFLSKTPATTGQTPTIATMSTANLHILSQEPKIRPPTLTS